MGDYVVKKILTGQRTINEIASEIYGGKPKDYSVILPSDLNDFKEELRIYFVKQLKNKYKYWNMLGKRYGQHKLTEFEVENYHKVYGKLQVYQEVLKKLGIKNKEINEYFTEEKCK